MERITVFGSTGIGLAYYSIALLNEYRSGDLDELPMKLISIIVWRTYEHFLVMAAIERNATSAIGIRL